MRLKYIIYKVYKGIRIVFKFILSFEKVTSKKLLTYSETINYVKDKKLSLIRWGDGETLIHNGIDIHYQIADKKLIADINKIIVSNNKRNSKFLLCMPNNYLKMSGINLIRTGSWRFWINTRLLYKYEFEKDIYYGDAFIFAKGREKEYEKLWLDIDNIIFVHSKKESFEYFSNCYIKKNVDFVQIDSENCYENLKIIQKRIVEKVRKRNNDTENIRVLVSAGPAGKVLVYRLSELNIIAYDTGHCWCEPLNIYDWEKT